MLDIHSSKFFSSTYKFLLNIIIACFVIYFISCFKFGTEKYIPKWARFGLWRMFTHKSAKHSDLRATAFYKDGWKEVNLRELFPSKWDSGYRFQRHVFWRNNTRMKMLAASTCLRLNAQVTEIKFYEDYWKIVPGIKAEKIKNNRIKSKQNLHWHCNQPLYTPKGTLVK